jgi:hypothetical protein
MSPTRREGTHGLPGRPDVTPHRVLVRREALRAAGLLDERSFRRCEEHP